MNCIKCLQRYNNTKRVPRVLIECGHTICQNCLTDNHKQGYIICTDCGKINIGPVQMFPKNLTLLNINEIKINQNEMCKTHRKKYEAYCQKDKELLCVNCMLDEKHRNHQKSSITNTVQKDKQILYNSSMRIEYHKEIIKKISETITEYEEKLKNNYEVCVHEINSFYESLKISINERQESTKQMAYEIFLKEHNKFDQIKNTLSEKYQFFNDIIKMYESIMKLKELDYLNQSNKRIFIVENSQYKVPKLDLDLPSINFNKNEEVRKIHNYLQQFLDSERGQRGSQATILNKTKNFKKKSSKQDKKQSVVVLQLNLNEKYKKHLESKREKEKVYINFQKYDKNDKKPQKFQEEKFNLSEIVYKSSENSYIQNSIEDIFKSSRDMTLSIRDKDYDIQEFQTKIYHLGGFGTTNYIEYFHVEKQYSKYLNIPLERVKFQSVLLKNLNKILIIGGKQRQSGEKLDSIITFDLKNEILQQSNLRLSTPRSGFGAILKDEKLYIVGGADSKTILNTLEEYNLKSNMKIKKLSNMSVTRDELSVVIGYDGYLYAIGGINHKGIPLNNCQRYDFNKNKWEILPNMNYPRRSFSLVSFPDGIYAIGGHDGKVHLNSIQKYDYVENCWVNLKGMTEGRSTHTSVCTFDYQHILVFGGYGNNKSGLKSIEIYSVNQNKWSYINSMNSERYMHNSIIIKSNI